MAKQCKRVILASGSPRRKDILADMGVEFVVSPSNVDESRIHSPFPRILVQKLATKKAEDVFKAHANDVVVAADTIVVKGTKELGKPKDRQDAVNVISRLSGKWHVVYTGVCVISDGKKKVFCDASKVKFKKLSKEEIEDYVDTFKPLDKAGAYGIQDGVVVEKYKGSYSNILGLPKTKLAAVLAQVGVYDGNN